MMRIFLLFFTFLTPFLLGNNLYAQGTCTTAVILTPGTQQCGDTADGGNTFDDGPCLDGFDDGDDYLFSYMAVGGETLVLTLTAAANSWTGIAITEGCPEGGAGTCKGHEGSDAGNELLTSETLNAGLHYIHISTFPFPQSAAFCLDAVVIIPPSPPIHDICGGAIVVAGGHNSSESTALSTNIEALPPCNGGGGGGICTGSATGTADFSPGVWFKYTSTTTETITAATDNPGTTFDTELQVFEGACGSLTCVGGDDDGGVDGEAASICWVSTGPFPKDYYIYLDGHNGDTGDYQFTLDATPYICGTEHINLPTTAGLTTSSASCDLGTWTYYEAASGEFIFAIEWDPTAVGGGHNAAAKAAAFITIQVDEALNSISDLNNGTFFMGRQWDVDLAEVAMDGPVNIKYYYDPEEKSAAETAAANHAMYYSLENNGFSWFKQIGSADFSNVIDVSFQPDVYLEEAGTGIDNGVTYVQFNDISSFSSGSGGAGAGGGALPVEFISFTGKASAKTNLLNWATASETNSSYYEVESSTDGRTFVNIGKVRAAGHSTKVLNYEFVDKNPMYDSYYRLKQVDTDGTYEYSDIVNVARAIKGINIGLVSPNPAKRMTSIQFSNDLPGKVKVTLMDVNGQIVSTQSLEALSGMNQVDLDLKSLAVGVYFVSVSNISSQAVTRIIKAK